MLRNYLKIAFRNLLRNKVFSGINIVGLSAGLAAVLFILLFVQDELRVGTQYPNAPQLYRVMEREFTSGKIVADNDTPGILADELKRQFPEVVRAAGFSWEEGHVLTARNKVIRYSGCHAGADWFSMFNVPLLAGTPATALNTPTSLAISRKLAETYFGSPQAAVGQSIRFDNAADYQVTAVFENLPANAGYNYEFLLNWPALIKQNEWLKKWTNAGPRTHLQLRPDADVVQFEAKIKWFLKGRNTDFGPTFHINLFLQPETDAYLYSNFKDGYQSGGRIEYVRLLAIVAAFLLLIAGINFMNLATARSVKRAKEVGVRKVVGAERSSLIKQFMGEALLMATIALGLAVVLLVLLLPSFNELTDKQLSLPLNRVEGWATLLVLLLVTGCLAGSYPALFLSSLSPVRVLKGALRFGGRAQVVRRGLVVFQFVMSTLLIVGTVIVYQQLRYVQTKNLGYDRENLINVPGEGELSKKYPTFKQELLQMPGIQAVTQTALNPLGNGNTTEYVNWPGKDPNNTISFNETSVGYDFSKVMKIRFVEGRDFTPAFSTDSTNYLVNQAAARRIGYKNPVGKPLTFWGKPGTIVGLVEDFHFNSLHVPITPLIIRLVEKGNNNNILIRTQPGQTKQALASIASLCRSLNPNFPFTYSFVDAEYQKIYKSESVVGTLATIFSGLAIFIACLGLFGLATFTAEQRTKEIGVRKVLGASVPSIVALLSKDFLKLVLIAIVIASPIAWYAMNRWLQDFAYKIDIEWWVFALAGLLAVGIALLTVSFQSIRAALMNPVTSLRSE